MFQINSENLKKRPPITSFYFIRKIVAFLKTGLLLHIISLVFLVLGFIIAKSAFMQLAKENWLSGIFISWLSSFCLTNSLLAVLDARSRWQNYKQLKDQLYEKGYRELIFKPVLKSRCQRDAALVAATELGYKTEVKQFFHNKGYRWYHVFPDFLFIHPQFLFTGYFWKTTFFVKKYTSKYFW